MYSVMFRKIYLQWNFIVNFLIFKVEDFYFYLFKLFPKISYVQKIIFLLLPNIRSFACTEFHLEWLYHAFDHHHSNFFIFVIAEAEYCFWQDRLHVGWSEFFQTFFQTCKMLHVYIIEETKFCHWNCVLWMFNFLHKSCFRSKSLRDEVNSVILIMGLFVALLNCQMNRLASMDWKVCCSVLCLICYPCFSWMASVLTLGFY